MTTNRIPIRGRARRSILNAGANRAARENIRAYRAHNEVSVAAQVVPTYVDPVPGRAVAMATHATEHGLDADAVEARAEEVIDAADADAIVVNVDNPGAVAAVVAGATRRALPVVGQLVVELPTTRVVGIRFALAPNELAVRDDAVDFFRALQEVTARSGADGIFGAEARGRGSLVEPALRREFATHTTNELARLTAGVLPEHAPLDITDGSRSMPLLVARRDRFGEPIEVVLEAAQTPPVPLRPSTVFFVAELGPDGIRLHEARRRRDGEVTVTGTSTIDAQALQQVHARSALADTLAVRRAVDGHGLGLLLGAAAGIVSAIAGAASTRDDLVVRSSAITASTPVITTD